MFEALTKGFRAARQKLTGLAELSEDNIDQALRDVRLSLLEADVELGVIKRFLSRVREKMLGQVVRIRAEHQGNRLTISPGEVFIKACQDELVAMMSPPDTEELRWASKGNPTVVMMVGLQGQGKTTTSAKLARMYARQGKKVLLVAADLQRPAAVEQLTVLGGQVQVPVFSVGGGTPVEVCRRALAVARVQKKDLVILDTAGRLAIDTLLMNELQEIKAETKPGNIVLVVNAAIGQNALGTAQTFHDTLGITGVALTMLDGDARGGAALSIREVTGVPVRFAGVGEGMDKLEAFRPDGMASRILGMGDVVGLVNQFQEVVDQKDAERDVQRFFKGQFTFDDFLKQVETLQRMGPIKDLIEKMPFLSEGLPPDAQLDDRELDKVRAMISSMTRDERARAELFVEAPGRVKRVAQGAGVQHQDVAELIVKFTMMRDLIGGIGKQASFLQRMPGAKQLAMARRLRDMVKLRGGSDQVMAGLAQEMLEAAVAGSPMGMPGSGDPGDLMAALMGGAGDTPRRSALTTDRKKDKRKQERQARKKNRRK